MSNSRAQSALPGNDEVLACAADEFARKGLAGARVDTIAQAAGINKATLYYRIGDKQALYEAVIERELGGMASRAEQAVATCSGPVAQLRAFIDAIAASLGCAAPILLREIASGGETMPDIAVDHMGRLVALLRGILTTGVSSGLFREVNPFIIHMMIVGGLNLYACNEPLRLRAATRNPDKVDADHFIPIEQAASAMHDYVVAALRPLDSTPDHKGLKV